MVAVAPPDRVVAAATSKTAHGQLDIGNRAATRTRGRGDLSAEDDGAAGREEKEAFMKKLSKGQLAEKTKVGAALNTAAEDLRAAIEKYNETAAEQWVAVAEAVEKYNNAIAETDDFRNDVIATMEDFRAEKSDKWQEGEAGEAYGNWIQEWENIELESCDIDQPDPLDEPDLVGEEDVDQLPDEV